MKPIPIYFYVLSSVNIIIITPMSVKYFVMPCKFVVIPNYDE